MSEATPRVRARAQSILAVLALGLLGFAAGCTALKRFSYEGFSRDGWQKPEQVVRSLEIQAGDAIADLGAGGGYFTFRLADAVGANGRVYAVDVDAAMIDYLKQRARDDGYRNVEVIQGKYDDPLLPPGGIDLVFICNTYHHLGERVAYFRRIQRYLRPAGRVAIVEFNHQGWFQRWFGHATKGPVIERELAEAGYHRVQKFDYLPRQHFLVFSPAAEGGEAQP